MRLPSQTCSVTFQNTAWYAILCMRGMFAHELQTGVSKCWCCFQDCGVPCNGAKSSIRQEKEVLALGQRSPKRLAQTGVRRTRLMRVIKCTYGGCDRLYTFAGTPPPPPPPRLPLSPPTPRRLHHLKSSQPYTFHAYFSSRPRSTSHQLTTLVIHKHITRQLCTTTIRIFP